MSLHQFLLILRARYRVALLIAVLAILGGLSVSLALPRQYTAQTAVLVDLRTPDPVAGGSSPGVVAPSYMATQVDIIAGERVAQRVVEMLGLESDPQNRALWLKATEGQGSLQTWLADGLQKGLDVRPARESNVINITYKGRDPALTAQIANAFAQAYLDTNLALKTEPARIYAEWFDQQAKSSRAKLEQAQVVEEYRFRVEREALESERKRVEALFDILRSNSGSFAETVQDPRYVKMLDEFEVMRARVSHGNQQESPYDH